MVGVISASPSVILATLLLTPVTLKITYLQNAMARKNVCRCIEVTVR